MRKNFGAKPYLYPQPVLIIASYGEDGNIDPSKLEPVTFDAANNAILRLPKNILKRK